MALNERLEWGSEVSLKIDAFADGQIASKLWLCEEIERLNRAPSLRVAVYGGWYGMLSFLLLSRGRLNVQTIRSLDIDARATSIAEKIGSTWEKFGAFTRDCNSLSPWPEDLGEAPDLIVNTSCEHFREMHWWENIPAGTRVALQSTDQPHAEHFACVGSLSEMKRFYPLSQTHFEGVKEFQYASWGFRRYMLIGLK